MNKDDIIREIHRLNQSKVIKVEGTDEERRIFKNRDEVFKIFGEDVEVLQVFNDYTYEWLHSFLTNVVEHLQYNDFIDLPDLETQINDVLFEWIDSEVDVYTSDLTKWLSDNISNIYYLNEAAREQGANENILGIAQYRAIEEVFNEALNGLMMHLRSLFEEAV